MDVSLPLLSSVAHVATGSAERYMVQLCRHFAHRLPVTQVGSGGRIEFPAGVCLLDTATTAGTLIITVNTRDEDSLPQLEDVVARHLARFAFRETLDIVWSRRGDAEVWY